MSKRIILFLAIAMLVILVGCDSDVSDSSVPASGEIATSKSFGTRGADLTQDTGTKSIDSITKTVSEDTKNQVEADNKGDKSITENEAWENEAGENEFFLEGIVKDNAEHLEIEVINSDYAFGIYWVLISPETKIYSENGDAISIKDIEKGDVLKIVYGGQVMLSYPPQIVAHKIRVTG